MVGRAGADLKDLVAAVYPEGYDPVTASAGRPRTTAAGAKRAVRRPAAHSSCACAKTDVGAGA
jgi:hypothetical protein